MKKFISLMLVSVMTAALVACGGGSSAPAATEAAPAETQAAAPAATEAAPAATEAAPAETEAAAPAAAAPAAAAYTILPPVLTEPTDEEPLGSPDATIRFKCGDTNAMTSAYNQGLVAFRKHLEELSGGEMTVDIYPSSSLGNESDMLDAVSMGTQDMLVTSTGPIPAFAKSTANWAVLDLPYLFPSYESAYAVLDGEVGQQLLAGFDGTGIKALAFWENGYRCTTNSKKEIVHPDDLKGMKIRTMENKVHMATYTALGATPTAMAMGEVFSALQQGTIDGQENPYAIIYYGNKLHEIQPYITQNDVFYSPAVLAISQDVFDGLTAEQQDILLQASELAKHEQRAIERGMQQMGRKNMEAFGCTVSDVDQAEWIEATKSVYDDASLGIDADLLAKIQDVVAGVQASLTAAPAAEAPAAEETKAEEAPAAEAPAGMLPPVLTEPVDADPLGSPDATVRLKCGDTNAMTSAYNQGLVALRTHLEELSGGTMTIDVYPSSSLGNESDMLDAVSMGTQDMLVTSTGPIPAFAKSTANWAVLDLPYLFPTYESAYEVLDGEVGQQLLAGFDGTGIKALAFWENGYRCTTNSKKEIVHPDDLKGMKIRTMENKVHMATYTVLGATPTAMAMGEVFSALQQGTIDGQENPYAIIYYGNKLHEIQPYITQNDVFYSPAVLAISEDVFNGLTEEQQGWLLEASELAKHEQRAIERGMQQMGRKNMEAFGCTVSDVDQAEWIEATKSVYDDASLGIDADLLAKIQAVTSK